MTYTQELDDPRCTLESDRPIEGTPRVAILASTNAQSPATEYANVLGAALGNAGAIVVAGVHSTAEQRALVGASSVKGKPWLIEAGEPKSDAGHVRTKVSESNGAIIRTKTARPTSDARSAHDVACALANVVVVLQSSSKRCPSLAAATRAFQASKRVWVVPPSPWMEDAEGSRILVRRPGIRPLWHTRDLLVSLGLAKAIPLRRNDPDEQTVIDALKTPLHKDKLLAATRMNLPQLSVTLINLMIEGVIQEGLDGRFELIE